MHEVANSCQASVIFVGTETHGLKLIFWEDDPLWERGIAGEEESEELDLR
jgi:hypothetical protein